MIALFLAALDQTIVTTALPRITDELGGLNYYAWVVSAYLLASVLGLPLFGRLIEIFPAKWVLLAAVVIFLAGSVLSGLAPSIQALIAFRALQGIGGGGILALTVTLIALLFPSRERGRRQGMMGAVFGISSVLGPWLGGLLTDLLSWRWILLHQRARGRGCPHLHSGVHAQAAARTARPVRPTGCTAAGAVGGAGSGRAIFGRHFIPLAVASGTRLGWLRGRRLATFFSGGRAGAPIPCFSSTCSAPRSFAGRWWAASSLAARFSAPWSSCRSTLVHVKGFSATNSGLSITPLVLGVVVGSILGGQIASRTGRV